MRAISDLISHIHARGGKITPQRHLIYRLLEGNTSHPTAEAIYDEVRKTLPTVSLTTVYKTLNELVEIGEVRRFDVNGVSHFDPNMEPHAEAVCVHCGAISDVFDAQLVGVPAVPGFRIIARSHTLYGYCAACDAAEEASMLDATGAPASRAPSHRLSGAADQPAPAEPEAGEQ